MTQTDYSYITDTPFVEGQLASAFPSGTSSFLNDSTEIITYGKAVVYDPVGDKLIIPNATGLTFRGITYKQDIYASSRDATGNQIFGVPVGEEVDFARQGEIGVFIETDVTSKDDPIFFRHTASGLNLIVGRFRTDADGGNADQVPAAQARWVETGTAGSIIKLAINFA